ncbi:hypothetical protein ACSHWB_31185 [Lentzea sp. HUAS TT2]|uniref:hypothetical protein n=1 Tax=Lentzea sp. HUAS TT2 TaxID=3447454 RepID=UPI003F72506F
MKKWKIAAAVASLSAALIGVGAQAQAQELKLDVGALGFGRQVTPIRDTGMYSGPGLSTPRVGTAVAGDNVAAVCQLVDSNGKRMVLGIDRNGRTGSQWANTAGYIWDGDIREITSDIPFCAGGATMFPSRDTGIYSAPGLSTPRVGTAWFDQHVVGVCGMLDSNGAVMVLGVQVAGRNGVQWANTAGYMWAGDFQGGGTLPACGAS